MPPTPSSAVISSEPSCVPTRSDTDHLNRSSKEIRVALCREATKEANSYSADHVRSSNTMNFMKSAFPAVPHAGKRYCGELPAAACTHLHFPVSRLIGRWSITFLCFKGGRDHSVATPFEEPTT